MSALCKTWTRLRVWSQFTSQSLTNHYQPMVLQQDGWKTASILLTSVEGSHCLISKLEIQTGSMCCNCKAVSLSQCALDIIQTLANLSWYSARKALLCPGTQWWNKLLPKVKTAESLPIFLKRLSLWSWESCSLKTLSVLFSLSSPSLLSLYLSPPSSLSLS